MQSTGIMMIAVVVLFMAAVLIGALRALLSGEYKRSLTDAWPDIEHRE